MSPSGDRRVVVITGAAMGIGRGMADHAAGRGDHVIILDLEEVALKQAVDEITAAGGSAEGHRVDVTNWDEMTAAADLIFATHGKVDILINNAGVQTHGLLWNQTHEQFQKLMDVNVTGVFHGVRAFVPRLVDLGKPAHVVFVASTGGLGARAVMAPYMASKHAIMGLAESLDLEFRAYAPHLKVAILVPLAVRSNIFLNASVVDDDASGVHQRDAQQRRNEREGMDPACAGKILFDGIDAGQLWIHTHPERSMMRIRERAIALLTGIPLEPPPEPE